MTQKPKKKSQIHGLVVFKGRLAQGKQVQIEIAPPTEDVDQENKIKLSCEFRPSGASYRCSISLENESMAPITEIKARIKYPNLLVLTRHYPPTIKRSEPKIESGMKQLNFEVEKLNEKSIQQINFYFIPLIINVKGDILASTSYINNKGFIRALNLEPIEIKIDPISIQPKIIPSSQIGVFLKIEGLKKAIKSHGIGIGQKKKVNLDLYFSRAEQLLKMHNFQLITKDNEQKIIWFFGNELESQEDILVIVQLVYSKIEFLAASKNASILVSLLTKLSNDFKGSIAGAGLVSIDQIYSLECKNCGNVLNSFPEKGMEIECQNCNAKQVVW